MKSKLFRFVLVLFLVISFSGCTFIFQKGRRSDVERIKELTRQLNELGRARELLEERLQSEIEDKEVSLKMQEKGLVITVLGDVLYDSGKASIRSRSYSILDKVARVLKENVPLLNVGIEGHTDNVPIKFSGWKSNWELSSARALGVLHYLSDNAGVEPSRLAAIAYGEYRPVASNATKEGRQLNRRVEIVILPELTKRAKDEGVTAAYSQTKVK
ncbi:MAG: hypothetical protein DRP74_01120 [Candidatus Omnitrophota bacterium]|nr:MAG: hypothetical protein DRP74_01120 [Candidatus Omnitrophota bacterium]